MLIFCFCEHFLLLVFTNFKELYSHIRDVEVNPKNWLWEAFLHTRRSSFFDLRVYGPRKRQNVVLLTVFETVPRNFFQELRCQTWVFGFSLNYRLGKSVLHKRLLSSFFETKSFAGRKFHLSDLLTVYWTFLDNYHAKSVIIGLVDTTGCWKLTFVVCCAQFFLKKVTALKQLNVLKFRLFFGSFVT